MRYSGIINEPIMWLTEVHFCLYSKRLADHFNLLLWFDYLLLDVCLSVLGPFRSSAALQGESNRDKEEEEF